MITHQQTKLGLIHTSATLVSIFERLCSELLPGVHVFNIVDDSLIKEVIAVGKLEPAVARRLSSHVQCAEQAGANLVLVTCSSVGEAAEASQAFVSIPVLRVDRPMADLAVAQPGRIGVVATLRTTLEPTASLLTRRASALGIDVEVDSRLCDGAFEALMSGDWQAHDQMVTNQIESLSKDVDRIVLAQASMARLLSPDLLGKIDKPVLASPRLAIESLISSLVLSD